MGSEAMQLLRAAGYILKLAAVTAGAVVIHESGHFLGGMIGGHHFEFIRFFRIVIFRGDDGKIGISVNRSPRGAKSLGQCIMTGDDHGTADACRMILGGGIANLCTAVLWLVVPWNSFLMRAAGFSVNLLAAAAALVPGESNDGATAAEIIRDPRSVRAYYCLMRIGAALQKGDSIDEMPGEWFDLAGFSEEAKPGSMAHELSELRRLRGAADNELP